MDFLKSAGGILATLAPTVASMLGGPLAGMATTALIQGLGLAPDASHEDIMKSIAGATPEQLLKLKEVEAQLTLDLKKLDVDLAKVQSDNLKIDAGDRDSARKREMEVKDYTPRILATLILSLYIGINYFIWSGHLIDPSMRDIVMRSLGTLDASVGLILGYYFGSSSGSRAKDAQISTLTDNAHEIQKNGK
jgi:hypothetical protein